MKHCYTTNDVCSKTIHFEVHNHTVSSIAFVGGCSGNLKALATLLEGMPIEEVILKLGGNTCGQRPTSCADQLVQALKTLNTTSYHPKL